MNTLITKTRADLFALQAQCRSQLETKSTDELQSLKHECDGLRTHEDFTARAAGQIVGCAVYFILESRP